METTTKSANGATSRALIVDPEFWSADAQALAVISASPILSKWFGAFCYDYCLNAFEATSRAAKWLSTHHEAQAPTWCAR